MCHMININLKSSETITSFVLNRNETEYESTNLKGITVQIGKLDPGRGIRDQVLQVAPQVDIVFWKGGVLMASDNVHRAIKMCPTEKIL